MTERERMLRGEWYDSRDPELLALAARARTLTATLAALPWGDAVERRAVLAQLLGAIGDDVWIETPFFCEYGVRISLGSHCFVNVNCVLLDAAPIRIGDHTLLAPGVQLLTATHPLAARERVIPPSERTPGAAPYRTSARPITIGRSVWIGANTVVLPGVTIGDNAVIGAGSIVTADIPEDVLAFGQPCRVQRRIQVAVSGRGDAT